MPNINAEFVNSLTNINTPDSRWEGFGEYKDGSFIPLTLEEFSKPIYEITLDEHTPTNIVTHFETAKNLALYSWYVYRFMPISELYAYITIEMALRNKENNTKTPFSKLLKKAVKDKVIVTEKLSHWRQVKKFKERQYSEALEFSKLRGAPPPPPPKLSDYAETLSDVIPFFRNTYAHGSSSISPFPYLALQNSADIINQVCSHPSFHD